MIKIAIKSVCKIYHQNQFINFIKSKELFIYSYMESFFVVGGRSLKGEVEIDSAKNSLLPILAGCILVKG